MPACARTSTPTGPRKTGDAYRLGNFKAFAGQGAARGLGPQARRISVPRYFITWSGHVQADVQGWPSRNCGVFPAVDHDRSRT